MSLFLNYISLVLDNDEVLDQTSQQLKQFFTIVNIYIPQDENKDQLPVIYYCEFKKKQMQKAKLEIPSREIKTVITLFFIKSIRS